MVQVYKESSVLDEFWMLKFGMGSKREWDTQGNTRLWMAANWTSGVAAMTRRMTLTISLCGLCMFSFRFLDAAGGKGLGGAGEVGVTLSYISSLDVSASF